MCCALNILEEATREMEGMSQATEDVPPLGAGSAPVTFLSKVAALLCEKCATKAESLPALAGRFLHRDGDHLLEKW